MHKNKFLIIWAVVAASIIVAACGGVGTSAPIDPGSIQLDSQLCPWQPNLIPATPYDDSQPPGPMGLPEHTQVNICVWNPENWQLGDPVIYLIPVKAYKQLWEENDNQAVSQRLDKLQEILDERPEPTTAGIPILPFEATWPGARDITVQGKYLDFEQFSGVRFVGRYAQDANPVTNWRLQYIFQGFSTDGQYFVAFFYPVSSAQLPYSHDEIPPQELAQFETDREAYMAAQTEKLDGLSESDWDPNLATLDDLLGSLTIEQ